MFFLSSIFNTSNGCFPVLFYFLKNPAFIALYIYIFTLQMGKTEPSGMAEVSVGSWGLKILDQHSLHPSSTTVSTEEVEFTKET